MSRYVFLYCAFLGFSCFASASEFLDSDEFSKSQTFFGGIGIIQNPTARFSDDGEFTFGISTEGQYNRIYAKMQFLPWLEAIINYTEVENRPYHLGNPQTFKDKGADLRFKLLDEGKYRPQLAIGILDIGGSSLFSSEYLVASKRWNNLDLTLGMAWGKMARRGNLNNPLGWFSDTESRASGMTGSEVAGALNLGRWFSGEKVAIFGGLEYTTANPNLTLKLEYDTNDYKEEFGDTELKVDSPFNAGLNYQFNLDQQQVDFSLGVIRGNTLYANLAFGSSLNNRGKPKYTAPPEILNKPYLEPFQELDSNWQTYLSELIMWQMGNEGFVTHKVIFNDDELQAEISQGRFKQTIQAIDLASRILANNSPKNIEKVTVINIDQGVETLRASIPRETLVEVVANGPLAEKYVEFNLPETLSDNSIIRDNDYIYPHFSWSIQPHMTGTLQHQIRFYFWQLEALIHTEYALKKGLYLMADIGIVIANNYDKYTWHTPDGQLHHVRQNRRLYLREGESGLRRMALDYLVNINSNITAKISAGYLEWMYGGVGGEVLYIPDHKNWALGIDAYWVKQREFDQKFSFQDYQTVTGFVSFYYDLPFYDLRLQADAGKFLGKDTGVMIDLSRRFLTGATVGARVALTNCNPLCVGEGSFNKWIYFNLPMDLFSKSTTRGKGGYEWSPLTKDAGQKVEPGRLFDLMLSAPDEVDSLRRNSWSIKKIFSGFGTTAKKKI